MSPGDQALIGILATSSIVTLVAVLLHFSEQRKKNKPPPGNDRTSISVDVTFSQPSADSKSAS